MILKILNYLLPVKNYLLLTAVVATLSACGDPDLSDLEQFVAETKAQAGPFNEKEPEFIPGSAYRYQNTNLRDPFTKEVRKPSKRLMSNRKREHLESFNLNDLDLVGTVNKNGTRWALIKTSDGQIHRVKTGNYIGRNNGKITDVTEKNMRILEVLEDNSGNIIRRPVQLSLK